MHSGNLLSIEGMCLDVVANSAVFTQHYCQDQVVDACDKDFRPEAMNFSIMTAFDRVVTSLVPPVSLRRNYIGHI